MEHIDNNVHYIGDLGGSHEHQRLERHPGLPLHHGRQRHSGHCNEPARPTLERGPPCQSQRAHISSWCRKLYLDACSREPKRAPDRVHRSQFDQPDDAAVEHPLLTALHDTLPLLPLLRHSAHVPSALANHNHDGASLSRRDRELRKLGHAERLFDPAADDSRLLPHSLRQRWYLFAIERPGQQFPAQPAQYQAGEATGKSVSRAARGSRCA